MPQSQFEVAYHVFPGKGDYKTGTYFQVMDYHEHDIGVSDAWKPVEKRDGECECGGDEEEPEELQPPLD